MELLIKSTELCGLSMNDTIFSSIVIFNYRMSDLLTINIQKKLAVNKNCIFASKLQTDAFNTSSKNYKPFAIHHATFVKQVARIGNQFHNQYH